MLKRSRTTYFTVLLVLLLGLSACTTAGGETTLNIEDLADTRWVLSSYGDIGSELPVVEGSTVTLEIGPGGQIGGSAGCNSYGGTYSLEDGKLSVGEITSTLMACTDELVMEQEEQFLTALRNASGIELSGDELTILYNEGKSALRFLASTAATTE